MDLKRLKSVKKGFTLIELMVVIVIIGILVAIALPNFISAQDRAKVASVKSNMHTTQTAVETYAVDWSGLYALKLQDVASEGGASSKNYWKEFKNPFSGVSGQGQSYNQAALTGSLVDNTASTQLAVGGSGTNGGLVGYQGAGTVQPVTSYWLYGSDKASKPISDKGKPFFLTNQ